MSDMQINQVLAQIRALSQQVRAPAAAAPGAPGAAAMGGLAGAVPTAGAGPDASAGAPAAGASDFAALLRRGIDAVSESQQQAGDLATQFQRGAPGVDLPKVMIEMQKAAVSFRALTEVRNRLVSAYQDIMNMQM